MHDLTIAMVPWAVGMMAAGLFVVCYQTGRKIASLWCPLNRRRALRQRMRLNQLRLQARLMPPLQSVKRPQVGRKPLVGMPPPRNGDRPPTPAWFREAAEE